MNTVWALGTVTHSHQYGSTTFPNSTSSWETKVQMGEFMARILHSKHRQITRQCACNINTEIYLKGLKTKPENKERQQSHF